MQKTQTEKEVSASGIRDLSRKLGEPESTVRGWVRRFAVTFPIAVVKFRELRDKAAGVAPMRDPDLGPMDHASIGKRILELQEGDSTAAETLRKKVVAYKTWLDNQEREGRLIDAAKSSAEVGVVLTMFQTRLMAEPKVLAASLQGLDPAEIERVLEGRFTEILGELRRGLEDAVKPEVVETDGRSASSRPTASEPVGGTLPGANAEAVVATREMA